MKTEELTALLRSQPALRHEVALEMQAGLPQFLMRGGELCVRFLPHKVRWEGHALSFGVPQYDIELIWPFRHLASFRNLALCGLSGQGPVCCLERDALMAAREAIAAYQAVADELLKAREEQGSVTPQQVEDCQRAFDCCISACGLGKVYGGR